MIRQGLRLRCHENMLRLHRVLSHFPTENFVPLQNSGIVSGGTKVCRKSGHVRHGDVSSHSRPPLHPPKLEAGYCLPKDRRPYGAMHAFTITFTPANNATRTKIMDSLTAALMNMWARVNRRKLIQSQLRIASQTVQAAAPTSSLQGLRKAQDAIGTTQRPMKNTWRSIALRTRLVRRFMFHQAVVIWPRRNAASGARTAGGEDNRLLRK